jgi:tetratricopeptide (TPR) repeat protein
MQQIQKQQSKWPTRVRVIGFILALLILIAGATVWALNSLNSLPALFATIFGALAAIIAFIQLIPIIFPQKSPQPAQSSQPASSVPPINIYNVIPPAQSAPPVVSSTSTEPEQHTDAPSRSNSLTLRAFPLPTGSRSIQQRDEVVKEIYTLLIDAGTAAVVLTGIGGIGKSTLAALVLNYAERERQAGKGPFRREAVLLRINENTTFLELAANLFAAVEKPMPDLSGAPPQNQAFAVVNALNTTEAADKPRLIILDQFENLLDPQSGQALTVNVGVGELIDAFNSQPCACRVLLTSRPRPRGMRSDAPASLRIYPVGGLDMHEGVELLRSQGVAGSEAELSEAVRRCNGHALSLTLLSPLLQSYGISLATLLIDHTYRQLWEGRIAEKLIDRIFNSLPEPSRQLLCACSVYREAVPIDALLVVIPNATKAQALTTLGSLLDQQLVQAQASSGLYLLHPIVATYAEQHFVVNDVAANKHAMQTAHAQAAQYYLQIAAVDCPASDKRGQVSDVQPLIEAAWQYCQAGMYQEAYELLEEENLFEDLSLWGGNTILLELCQLLLAEDWQFAPQEKARIYSNIASTSSVLGQKQEALKYYEQSLRINKEVGDRGVEGTMLSNLGAVYDDLGQKQEALTYYEQALQITREVGDRGVEGTTLSNLGLVYSALGQKQEALTYYEQALQIVREVGDRGVEGATLNNLGGVYDDLGQKQEALTYYEQALPIRREVGDRGGEGTTLNNLGRVYDDLGQKQEALTYYEQALKLHKEVQNPFMEGITLHNMGMIYFNEGSDEIALACILLAKALFERVQSTSDVNDEVQWIADLQQYLGEEQFATLLAQVEPRAEQIVEEALQRGVE